MNYQTRMETTTGTKARAAVSVILARMGHSSEEIKSDLGRNRDLEHLNLLEIARTLLNDKGGPAVGGIRNNHELVNRAMTTTDFPSILKDVANKLLEATYQYAPATFEIWTSRGIAKDFNISTIARLVPPADLPEIEEDGEYQYLTIKDGEENFQLKTYGGILPISRQAIINDDLSALADTAKILGMTTKISQNKKVYSYLMENPVLSDEIPVFDTSRGNYMVGETTGLNRDSLALAVKIMRLMSDGNGSYLNAEPKYLLVGPSLEVTAHELCYSDSMPGQSNSAVPNFFKKIGITPVVEPLLEAPAIFGNSSTAWYLLPDPALWPTFRVFGLGKELTPFLDSLVGFERDNIEYKVRTDFGAAAIGRFAVKSKGEA